jgi:thymidylate kinase
LKPEIIFVETFFNELIAKQISFCIIRNVEEVMHGDAHDVDIAVDNTKHASVNKIISNLCCELGWKKLMEIKKNGGRRIIFCNSIDEICFIQLDFFDAFTWNEVVLLNSKQLLENIDKSMEPYYKADLVIETVQELLARLLPHGHVKDKYKENVRKVFLENRESALATTEIILGKLAADKIYEYVIAGQWDAIDNDVTYYRNCVLRNQKKVNLIYKKISNGFRILKRLIAKPGIMVVFEGPDGSGKSTIIDKVFNKLERVAFPEEYRHYYHWRPGLIKSPKADSKADEIITEPHKDLPYNKIVSMGKFLFFNLDFIFGYWFKVRIELAKGKLIVFDRYYYDYYLDKLRYRLDISDKMLNICILFIPKPDLTFLLIGDAYSVYERKKEISIEKIIEQNESLIKNRIKFRNSQIINVNNTISQVVEDVTVCIIKELEHRF